MNSQLSLDAYRKKLPTKKAALRELLADGRWHGQHEMAKVAGHRFGSALFDLHNEVDFATGVTPLHYQKHVQESDGTRVRYRVVDQAACDICSKEAKKKPSEIIAELRKRIEDLEIRLAYAEGRGS